MVIALAPERAQLCTVMDSLHFSVSMYVKKIAERMVATESIPQVLRYIQTLLHCINYILIRKISTAALLR